VFNGDIGFITAISDEDEVTADFDGNRVTYRARDLDELVHAYCISIHKSQGCEFRCVVIPVSTQHYVMLQRNLLYTAVTRGKRLVVLVGTTRAVAIAVRNDRIRERHSLLRQRLAEGLTA